MFSVNFKHKYLIHFVMHFFDVLILNTGGEGLKHSLHIPGVYFKRFLPVSNLVSLDFSVDCEFELIFPLCVPISSQLSALTL